MDWLYSPPYEIPMSRVTIEQLHPEVSYYLDFLKHISSNHLSTRPLTYSA